MHFRKIKTKELDEALNLVWRVFLQFEAPDYSQEGIEEFNRSIHSKEYIDMLRIYACFDSDKIIGVIATRNNGNHIALFFVDDEYQRKGIGRKLFETATKNSYGNITVKSSPFAVDVYHRLGFSDTSNELLTNGLRYTPMVLVKDIDLNQQVGLLLHASNTVAYEALKNLLSVSKTSSDVYLFMDDFIKMISSKNSYIRTRGILLVASNAKWDERNIIDENIDCILNHILDEKPLTSRKCIASLPNIARFKKDLVQDILNALRNANFTRYPESMTGLLEKDRQNTIKSIIDNIK